MLHALETWIIFIAAIYSKSSAALDIPMPGKDLVLDQNNHRGKGMGGHRTNSPSQGLKVMQTSQLLEVSSKVGRLDKLSSVFVFYCEW